MSRVVVLTPNPAVDVTYRVPRQQLGETLRAVDLAKRPGGKGVNVVRVLRQLGEPAISVLPLGGTAGLWIAERLTADGFDVRAVDLADDSRTTVTLVDDVLHPTTVNEPGPAVGEREWRHVEVVLGSALRTAEVLVVAGSLPRGADPAIVGTWIGQAQDAGVPMLCDVSGPALLVAADARADVLKGNRAELIAATGECDEAEAAARLLDRGCGTVVVSRGREGLAGYGPSGVIEVPAVPGITGNPVGAGDAATAGFVCAMVAGLPLSGQLRRAAAAGAAAVLRPVAGEIDRAAYDRFVGASEAP